MGLLNNKLKDKKTIAVFFGLFIFVTLMGYQTKNSDLSSLYKSYIENQIAEVLGLTAEIGEFEIDWLDSSPLIIIDRLDLRRSDLQTNILLENLVLNISLSESFLNMQIIISDFSVDGISVGLNTFSGPNQLDVYGTLELEKSENFQRALLSFLMIKIERLAMLLSRLKERHYSVNRVKSRVTLGYPTLIYPNFSSLRISPM